MIYQIHIVLTNENIRVIYIKEICCCRLKAVTFLDCTINDIAEKQKELTGTQEVNK